VHARAIDASAIDHMYTPRRAYAVDRKCDARARELDYQYIAMRVDVVHAHACMRMINDR
jgi:hypothetical protein